MRTKKIAENEIPVQIERQRTMVGSPMIMFRVDPGMMKTHRQLSAHIFTVAAELERRLDAHGSRACVSVSTYDRRITVEHGDDDSLATLDEVIDEALELVGPMGVQIS